MEVINLDTSGAPLWIRVLTHVFLQGLSIYASYCSLLGLYRSIKWLLFKLSGRSQHMTFAELTERARLNHDLRVLRVREGILKKNADLEREAIEDHTRANEAVRSAAHDIYNATEAFKHWLGKNSHVKTEDVSELQVLMKQMLELVQKGQAEVAAREALRLEQEPISDSLRTEMDHAGNE